MLQLAVAIGLGDRRRWDEKDEVGRDDGRSAADQ